MKIDITLKDVTIEEASFITSSLGLSPLGKQTIGQTPIVSTPNLNIHSIEEKLKEGGNWSKSALEQAVANPVTPTHPTPAMKAADEAAKAEAETKPKVVPKGEGLDADGIPWDSRIHAATKTRTAKNVWKKGRGVDAALYQQVVAELKAANTGNISATAEDRTEPVAPPTPPAPLPTPAQVTPAAPVTRDFAGLLTVVQNAVNAATVTPDYPNTIVTRINEAYKTTVATLADISANEEMVEYGWQCVEVDEIV